jgi:hypothetical protein
MQHLRDLEGLLSLDIAHGAPGITAVALEPLASLPHLEVLGIDATDAAMPYLAAMPRLRFAGIQDTSAGDAGFEALSKSPTIEYIWGRRCHHLGQRGFAALAGMPALRGLAVSCLNVNDAGVAALPSFPALRELMPIDVPDAGYRHIGSCAHLESLILMYCRETTDAATAYLTTLGRLTYYFNSYTAITDRTPAVLSTVDSLERITFDNCHGLTDDGVAQLARLPALRELRASGRRLTPAITTRFPSSVAIFYDRT